MTAPWNDSLSIFDVDIFLLIDKSISNMFTSSDPNLPDLDFELVDERQQNNYLNEAMLKDLLSSPTSTYRIVKPT